MGAHEFSVPVADALDPLVLALDVGSTGSRGCLFDARGLPLKGRRLKVAHAFTTDADGTAVIDADQIVSEISTILTALTDGPEASRIAGVSFDTFASSLVGVGRGSRAVTPCYTYADGRAGAQVDGLRGEVDETALQQETGTRLHGSYLPARLRWLEATDPGIVERTPRWMSLGEYVHHRILGATAAGTATAAWSGLLDRRAGDWHPDLLSRSGIRREQLSDIHDPDEPIAPASDHVRQHWPVLADVPWFPAIADGYAANRGSGADDASRVVASAATSGAMRVLVDGVPQQVPSGLWCYRIDAGHQLLGGAVNDCGRAVDWAKATLRLPDTDGALDAICRAEPTAGTPLVLPFLTGERSTGWASGARAHLAGVTAATTPEQMFRGVVDGVALTYARVLGQLAQVAGMPDQVLLSGGVTAGLPGIGHVLAQALGVPVALVPIKRATLHGTALTALDVIAPDVERAPVPTTDPVEPVDAQRDYWRERLAAFEDLYGRVV